MELGNEVHKSLPTSFQYAVMQPGKFNFVMVIGKQKNDFYVENGVKFY